MLTGFVECGQCHGSLIVRTTSHGKRRAARLSCWHYQTRGVTVCANNTHVPLDELNALVLNEMSKQLLAPGLIDEAIASAIETDRIDQEATSANGDRAIETLAALDLEAERLAALTAAGLGDLPAVIDRLKVIQSQRATVTRLTETPASKPKSRGELRAMLQQAAQEWRSALQANPVEAKPVLELMLTGRIVITPRSTVGAFDVRIPLTLQGLVDAVIAPKALASPTGFEPVF
jgi:hypothetical protein